MPDMLDMDELDDMPIPMPISECLSIGMSDILLPLIDDDIIIDDDEPDAILSALGGFAPLAEAATAAANSKAPRPSLGSTLLMGVSFSV
jgi:hypothetical protein